MIVRSIKTIGILALILNSSVCFAADIEKGKLLFGNLCATCHGAQGAGDGPIAASLPPEMKPRNLITDSYKVATDDAKLKELLTKGGAALGLNPLMPPAPVQNEAEMENLIAFVKSLKKGS